MTAPTPSDWTADLATLTTAWNGLSANADAAAVRAEAARIVAWRMDLATLLPQQHQIAAAGDWHPQGPADLLTVAGLGRWELAHTAVLGWLLSPAREHGLGSAFLDRLLASTGEPPIEAGLRHQVRVTTEECREDRRADIIVRWPGRALVIEAKVDASESPNQCTDLRRLFGDEPGVRFIFLTPGGYRPTSAGDSLEAWTSLSLRAVCDILAELADDPARASAPGATAVRSYLHTLEAQFPKKKPMLITPRLRFYLENKRVIDEWAALPGEGKAAADAFFRTLAEPIRALVAELGDDVRLYVESEGGTPKFFLYRESWLDEKGNLRAGIGLEWGSGGNAAFHRAYTGVWVNRMVMDASAPLRARVAARLDANGAVKEQSSVWWPRFSYEPTPEGTWWDDLPGFRKQLTDRIATRWQTFRGSVDEAIREGA